MDGTSANNPITIDIPSYLCSLDIGYKNLAMALFDTAGKTLVTLQVFRIDFDAGPKDKQIVKATKFILDQVAEDTAGGALKFVMEEQRHRTNGGPIFESVFWVNQVSIAILTRLSALGYECTSVNAKVVAERFGLSKLGTKKKAATAKLVSNMLRTGAITAMEAAANYFNLQKKKDDLADAILQGLWAQDYE
jgi:hypothetical protein